MKLSEKISNERILKEIKFQLDENGFIDESDNTNRFSSIAANNLLVSYCHDNKLFKKIGNIDEEEQIIDEEIPKLEERISTLLKDNFNRVIKDNNCDCEIYYYDDEEYNFSSVEELKKEFFIGE